MDSPTLKPLWDALEDDDDIASDLAQLATDIEQFLRLKDLEDRCPESERYEQLLQAQWQIVSRIEFLDVLFGARRRVFDEYEAHLAQHGLRQRLAVW